MNSKIRTREQISPEIIENIKFADDWHYGFKKKSHYSLNQSYEIIGCLNLIFLFKNGRYNIFYIDTIEVRKDLKRRGIGTNLINFVINSVKNRYENPLFYLLVANCQQYRLKFFSKNKFNLIKLRKNKRGSHCIMTSPLVIDSEEISDKIFEYFHWRTENVDIISSDCKYAYNPNPTGLYWCEKKKIFVTGMEKQSCQFYVKTQGIMTKEKFIDLYKHIN